MRSVMSCIVLLALVPAATAQGDWKVMFDGKSLKGWKASENKDSWKVEDGAIVAAGPRSHLFYVDDDKPFKNFEFTCEVMTKPRSNSGIYIHTKYQDEGWPKFGYEAQVNNSGGDPKRTGSIYAVKNTTTAPAKDNEWFTYTIRVEGQKITTMVNGKTVIEYEEPVGKKPGNDFTRKLDQGTFALQAHDPQSVVYYRKLKVRRLP